MKRAVLFLFLSAASIAASAAIGAPDYTGTASALKAAYDALTVYMTYAVFLSEAVAAVVAVISALQIYFKMNNGEDGVKKSMQMLFWSIMFLIGATIVFPAFFGYRFIGSHYEIW